METKNINIAEILQKAPRNMDVTLYSPLLGKCTLNGINQNLIWVTAKDGLNYSFQHHLLRAEAQEFEKTL